MHISVMHVSPLQQRAILCGSARAHHFAGVMPLSVKKFTGGTAHYTTARGRYAVDEESWLIINDQESYAIDFDLPTPVRSTVVFFPAGWADIVARVYREREIRLLDDPAASGEPVQFLETVMPRDNEVCPLLQTLDTACRGKIVPEDWLEEQLRDLLAAVLLSQHDHRRRADTLPASKAATRAELYRRLCRGRDFLGSVALTAPTLVMAAKAACLSPYHFQRCFKRAFDETPHEYTLARRLAHARHMLQSTEVSAAEVCEAIGYESYSSFHAAYFRRYGVSPRTRN